MLEGSLHSSPSARFPWWVPVWGVLLSCLYLPTVPTHFDFYDDGLTAYPEPVSTVGEYCRRVWLTTLDDFHAHGPFRPVAWAFWFAEAELFDGDPLGWRLVRFFWTALAAAAMLWLLRELGIRPLAAVLTTALALANPYRGEIWISLTHSEGLAMPLALAALVCARRAPRAARPWLWDVAGLACMLFALGCKNTFAAVVPVQVLLRFTPDDLTLWEGWRRYGARACSLAVTLALPVSHYLAFRSSWHEGRYRTEATWAQAGRMIHSVLGAISIDYLTPVLVVVGLAFWANRRRFQVPRPEISDADADSRTGWQRYRAAFLAGLLLLALGIGIYVPLGGVAGRYSVPAVWGADLWIAVLLDGLAAVSVRGWKRAAYTALAVSLAAVVVANLGKQLKLGARIDLLWQALTWVEQEATPAACVAWVSGEPVSSRDSTLTIPEGAHFAWHLWGRGHQEVQFQAFDVQGRPHAVANYPSSHVSPNLLLSGTATPPPGEGWQLQRELNTSYWGGLRHYSCYLWTRNTSQGVSINEDF